MSTTQYLTDAATRHQVFLQRYGGGQSKEAIALLMRLRRSINARLSQEPTEFQRQRLTAVLADIEALATVAFNDIAVKSIHGSQQLATSEAAFSAKLLNKATLNANFVLPAENTLLAAVAGASMAVGQNVGVTIEEAFAQFNKKKTAQILATISDGVVLGETTPTISKNVGLLINNLQRRQLDTLVRTVTNHTSSVARAAVYEQNSDLIDGYVWISTLDSRTTLICASRDNKVFQAPNDPLPPAHWGCRSTTIPKVKPEYDLGSSVTGRRAQKGATKGTVSAKTSYGGWLRKQPREFVDEALGVERSRLFRSGKLTIGKFVDPTGRVYTLTELESRNPFVFAE